LLEVGNWELEVVLSESARMSSATEARFRIQTPPPTNRAVKMIDLDAASDADVMRVIGEIEGADLVLMVVRAGGNTTAVSAIGTACSDLRVMTHTVVIRDRASSGGVSSDAALSKTLGEVRPWSLMVVVVDRRDYVDDILTSFR
jgi:2-phospho-L-lactate guanylyltransferase (CobY/MobA/RfbA family)